MTETASSLTTGSNPGDLVPDHLAEVARAAEAEFLRQGESDNTLRSYRSALRYWSAWHALRFGRAIALPVPEDIVVQFIVDHAERTDTEGHLVSELPPTIAMIAGGYKAKRGAPALTTLLHRVAVLSKVHQLKDLENPCGQVRIRELLSKVRKGYAKRGALPQKKPALTREPLEELLDTCDDSLAGLRDRALLLATFSSGGRRRSEIGAATIENTTKRGLGYVLTVAVSKTNQRGADRPENDKPIVGRAAVALGAWIRAARIHGRRQLSCPAGDNYPGGWGARDLLMVRVVSAVCSSISFSTAVWQAERVRP
jgi:integrase